MQSVFPSRFLDLMEIKIVESALPPKICPSDELVIFYNSPAKGGPMAKRRYSAEQIIQLLREVEIHTSEGKTISQASRQIGVTELLLSLEEGIRWTEYRPGQKAEKTGSRSVSG